MRSVFLVFLFLTGAFLPESSFALHASTGKTNSALLLQHFNTSVHSFTEKNDLPVYLGDCDLDDEDASPFTKNKIAFRDRQTKTESFQVYFLSNGLTSFNRSAVCLFDTSFNRLISIGVFRI